MRKTIRAINRFAYRMFGSYAYRHKNIGLQTKLRQAHIHISVDMYQSIVLLYSIIAIIIIGMGTWLISTLIYPHLSAMDLHALNPYKYIIFVYLPPIVAIIIVLFLISLIYYWYPSFKQNVIASKIDRTLPYAVTYMHAMSRGDMNLYMVFKSLSLNSYIYGEAATEISYIIRDIDVFDKDLIDSLVIAGNRTNSKMFKDFINSLVTVMNSGGDITNYFESQSSRYRTLIEDSQKAYLESIGLIAEIYITAFVVGPLLLITILVVLGLINPTSASLLGVVIYGVIPVCSLFSVMLVDLLTGTNEEVTPIKKSEALSVFEDIPISRGENYHERYFFTILSLNIKSLHIINAMKRPAKQLMAHPKLIFLFSVPYAILYLGGAINSNFIETNDLSVALANIDNNIVLALIITFLPFVIFYELQISWTKKMDGNVPDFLDRLATINESGLNLTDAIGMTVKSEMGLLTYEIGRVWKNIRWGMHTSNALYKFEMRANTPLILRTITLIIKANESISDIRSVLRIAALDANAAVKIQKTRLSNVFMYVAVVYISYFVFLLIIYVLSTVFLDSMPAQTSASGAAAGAAAGFVAFDKELYIRLLYHATLIQGFFSGLVTGQLGEDSMYSGLKHSLVMIFIAYLAFNVFM